LNKQILVLLLFRHCEYGALKTFELCARVCSTETKTFKNTHYTGSCSRTFDFAAIYSTTEYRFVRDMTIATVYDHVLSTGTHNHSVVLGLISFFVSEKYNTIHIKPFNTMLKCKDDGQTVDSTSEVWLLNNETIKLSTRRVQLTE